MTRKSYARPAAALVFVFLLSAAAAAQTPAPAQQPFGLRQGQSVYIVAFTRALITVGTDAEGNGGYQKDYFDFQLDVEKKVRNEIEKWKYFRVADKPSDADFVFLVSYHYSTMEGLAISFDAYDRHFKEKFDLDALRDAAYGRAISGPLKLATLSRLSSRLVKDFRQKLPAAVKK
ncbi:MAG TPA: hypothetical protein VN282_05080 [Pyrinomonadaceae bacterium]|nr:hypothetical protein [Pyrinomonadaceae bacterium]